MTKKQVENDVRTMNNKLWKFDYFRPPFLSYTETWINTIINQWKKFSVPTIDCPDWLWKNDEKIIKCVLSKAHDRWVVMLHEEFSSKAISKILDGLSWWDFRWLDGSEINGSYKYTLPEIINSEVKRLEEHEANVVQREKNIDSVMKFWIINNKNCNSDDVFAWLCRR